jgi:hypothetical protein
LVAKGFDFKLLLQVELFDVPSHLRLPGDQVPVDTQFLINVSQKVVV